jgi:hypothetical protein
VTRSRLPAGGSQGLSDEVLDEQAVPDTWVTLFAFGRDTTPPSKMSRVPLPATMKAVRFPMEETTAVPQGDRAGGRHKVFSPATRCVPVARTQNAVPAQAA